MAKISAIIHTQCDNKHTKETKKIALCHVNIYFYLLYIVPIPVVYCKCFPISYKHTYDDKNGCVIIIGQGSRNEEILVKLF